MTTSYNQIAGQSVERLAALSDGIFAVAMTLLVLDLRVPAADAVHSEHDLWRALVALSPRLVAWIHIVFLFAVSITPFSTMLLAEFIAYRLALIAYWLNIALLGWTLYFSWMCATVKNRIVIAQSLYAFGALLCVISTYWSIGFIVLVQLNYALAPRLTGRSKP